MHRLNASEASRTVCERERAPTFVPLIQALVLYINLVESRWSKMDLEYFSLFWNVSLLMSFVWCLTIVVHRYKSYHAKALYHILGDHYFYFVKHLPIILTRRFKRRKYFIGRKYVKINSQSEMEFWDGNHHLPAQIGN